MSSMKDCKKIQPLLSEYVDGALPADASWAVKLHLASCAVCARAEQELAATVSLLAALPRQDTSGGFEAALARRLADQVLQPRRPTLADRLREWWSVPGVRPSLAMAGAMAAIVPVLFLMNGRQTPSPGDGPVIATTDMPPQRGEQVLQTIVQEHASFASAEPLGDQSAVILTSYSGDTY